MTVTCCAHTTPDDLCPTQWLSCPLFQAVHVSCRLRLACRPAPVGVWTCPTCIAFTSAITPEFLPGSLSSNCFNHKDTCTCLSCPRVGHPLHQMGKLRAGNLSHSQSMYARPSLPGARTPAHSSSHPHLLSTLSDPTRLCPCPGEQPGNVTPPKPPPKPRAPPP